MFTIWLRISFLENYLYWEYVVSFLWTKPFAELCPKMYIKVQTTFNMEKSMIFHLIEASPLWHQDKRLWQFEKSMAYWDFVLQKHNSTGLCEKFVEGVLRLPSKMLSVFYIINLHENSVNFLICQFLQVKRWNVKEELLAFFFTLIVV